MEAIGLEWRGEERTNGSGRAGSLTRPLPRGGYFFGFDVAAGWTATAVAIILPASVLYRTDTVDPTAGDPSFVVEPLRTKLMSAAFLPDAWSTSDESSIDFTTP